MEDHFLTEAVMVVAVPLLVLTLLSSITIAVVGFLFFVTGWTIDAVTGWAMPNKFVKLLFGTATWIGAAAASLANDHVWEFIQKYFPSFPNNLEFWK